jgi:hypothetical protein
MSEKSDKWKIEPACFCRNCVAARSEVATNHDVSHKRQHIAIRFEIGLPLKQDELVEATSLLESLLSVLHQARREEPQAVTAVASSHE